MAKLSNPHLSPEQAKLILEKQNKSKNTTYGSPNPHGGPYNKGSAAPGGTGDYKAKVITHDSKKSEYHQPNPHVDTPVDTWDEYVNPNEETLQAAADQQKKDNVKNPNEETLNAGGTEKKEDPFERKTGGEPNIRPPTRAQDTYSLNQAPTVYMAGVPRQRFQYLATFRFASDTSFEEVFGDTIDTLEEEYKAGISMESGDEPRYFDGSDKIHKEVKNPNDETLKTTSYDPTFGRMRQLKGSTVPGHVSKGSAAPGGVAGTTVVQGGSAAPGGTTGSLGSAVPGGYGEYPQKIINPHEETLNAGNNLGKPSKYINPNEETLAAGVGITNDKSGSYKQPNPHEGEYVKRANSNRGMMEYANATSHLRNKAIEVVKKSLMWNIKSIDGPKINLAVDTLNQYNRKRNVYRSVQYDPINVRFYDTMNNTALHFWRWLYESHILDGRNKSKIYNEGNSSKKGTMSPYENNTLSREDFFLDEHNYGVTNSIGKSDYPIKSLDLFLIHGKKYNLIRFVHPRITAMDHDTFTYESSAPIEVGMQFAYETVLYETFNYPFDASKHDINIDLGDAFKTSDMPGQDESVLDTNPEGGDGTFEDNYRWTQMAGDMNLQDTLKAKSYGDGSKLSTDGSWPNPNQVNTNKGSIWGSILGGSPISDAIGNISKTVYDTTKSAVSWAGAGLNTMGSSNTKKNKNYITKGDTKYVSTHVPGSQHNKVDVNGNLKKNVNGNVQRGPHWNTSTKNLEQ